MNEQIRWTWPSAGLVAISLLAIACAVEPVSAESTGCLHLLKGHEDRTSGDREFDTKFDRVIDGDYFSCNLSIGASEARRVLDDFRYGFLYDSAHHIQRSVRFPLTARAYTSLSVIERPSLITIATFEDWLQFKKDYLTPSHSAMISCANVMNVAVRKTKGFAIGKTPFIWFTGESGDITVTAISVVPTKREWVLEFCAKAGPRPGVRAVETANRGRSKHP